MQRLMLIGVLSISCSLAAAPLGKGQIDISTVPRLEPHHQPEFSLDTNTEPARWEQQQKGLNAAFGSTDELYLRCEIPDLKGDGSIWEAAGWKGERLNAQVLVWSPDAQEQVRCAVGDLRDNKGNLIKSHHVRVHTVRYVLSNLPYQAKGFSCDVTNDVAFLLPDRLEDFARFDLPARTVRPVWLSIDIPANAKPGDYSGALQVWSSTASKTLQLRIQVQQMTLPEPKDWQFRLDLWQNPWVISSYFQVKPWSEEHKLLLKQHLKLYAQAGGTYITTYTVYSPWSDNSYILEGTMIEWLKARNGGWKFDYSIFDQYVELAMEAGVDEAITIYTPVPWGHRFRYLDEASGNYVYEEWAPKSAEFKAFWNVFLNDLKQHLTKKGWLEKTYLGINENPLDVTLAAIEVIKQNSKEWRITYAGNWHSELSPLIDDYCTVIPQEPDPEGLADRRRRKFTTTFYVCCNPPQPNNFVFSAPVEGRYLGRYAAAYGYEGFLRWAYDAWPADPMRDARHTLWPAGDCFLVYPGGSSSVRFEKLREGIVDYEKIQILRKMAKRSSSEKAKTAARDLEKHLRQLAAERDYAKRDFNPEKLTETLKQGQKLIETMSLELAK